MNKTEESIVNISLKLMEDIRNYILSNEDWIYYFLNPLVKQESNKSIEDIINRFPSNWLDYIDIQIIDFNASTVKVIIEIDDDYSFSNPIIREEGLFVPEYDYSETLPAGQYFVRVKATNESGYEQYAFDYYVTSESIKKYGVLCFYVLEDGTIVEDTYEE